MGAHLEKRSLTARISLVSQYVLCTIIFGTLALLLLQAAVVETFHIPSGSMAPALRGHHRVGVCPRCGHEVAVGQRTETGETRSNRKAFCPNCGLFPLPMASAREIAGDQIQVDRSAYLIRSPTRWEIVVFRLLGSVFIKRLLGLPGEELRIHDGDVYVNGKLLRKNLAEARAMRVLIFDHAKAPKAVGWKDRWESEPRNRPPQKDDGILSLDGRHSPATLTYRHFLLNADKCEPIRDEYAYNGGVHADSECVHDFLIEADIEASPGRGSLALRLCDGRDWVEVLVPIGMSGPVEAFAWPLGTPEKTRKLADSNNHMSLRAGQRYRVELAFVDRRVILAVDGRTWLSADLPAVKKRLGVERPFQFRADGVQVSMHRFRLYRDVHYGQQGTHAVRGKSVRLAADQYFMLGDNSSNSEDSRFWPNEGRIEASALIGPLLRVRRN